MPSSAFDNLRNAFRNNSLDPRFGLDTLRTQFHSLALALKASNEAIYEDITIDLVKAQWIDVLESNMSKVILFIHGGCFTLGKLDIYSDFTARLAHAAKSRVLAVDYSLAPESPFPAALSEIANAYKYLLDKEYDPNNIFMVGTDAGANMAISACLNFRSVGLPMPAGLICISPWTDLALTSKSIHEKAMIDPVLSPELLKYCADMYVGVADNPHIIFSSSFDRCDAFVSPFYGDLTGLPPLLVMAGESEILLDDAVRFTKKAEFYGVETRLVIAEQMIHGWSLFAPILPEGQQAVDYIGNYINQMMREEYL